jgi:hypothetical protein
MLKIALDECAPKHLSIYQKNRFSSLLSLSLARFSLLFMAGWKLCQVVFTFYSTITVIIVVARSFVVVIMKWCNIKFL